MGVPGVTLAKLRRDAANLKKHARFVLILKGSEIELIDNAELREKGIPYAKLIVILGPACQLSEAVLMEVGYCRTRPYRQVEEKIVEESGKPTGKRWCIKGRHKARSLSEEEFMLIYPHLALCIKQVVDEHTSSWAPGSKGLWWLKRFGDVRMSVFRGIHFTVSNSDEPLCLQLMCEDMAYRKKRYIDNHVRWVSRMLKTYRCAYYAPKRLRSYARAQRIVQLLSRAHYVQLYRMVFLNSFANRQKRTVLDLIVDSFEVDLTLTELEQRALAHQALPNPAGMQCYCPPDQPKKHGRNTMLFEFFPDGGGYDHKEVAVDTDQCGAGSECVSNTV